MICQRSEINYRAKIDPLGFVLESEAHFQEKINRAAEKIAENRRRSPFVLLSGPSGSGKTTTAMKLKDALLCLGIHAHTLSIDDYFLTLDPLTAPRTESGAFDFESPGCVDWALLHHHFMILEQGGEIVVPKFDFSQNARRAEPQGSLQLHADEMVIVEGIHALRDELTEWNPNALNVYISTQTDLLDGAAVCVRRSWVRLVRRAVRDYQFRGASLEVTMGHWANVRRGEAQYVAPFQHKADVQIDSVLPYELPVMKQFVTPLLEAVPMESPCRGKVNQLLQAMEGFVQIDAQLPPTDSLLREFIGGGSYHW